MKKIIDFFLDWFQNNGLFKILAAIAVLIISALFLKNTHSDIIFSVFNTIGIASIVYLMITFLVFFIAAVINTINDIRKK